MILFYTREMGDIAPPARLPDGVGLHLWRPALDGCPPRGSRNFANVVWWLMTVARLFSNRDFAEFTLWRGGRLVHRLIVTPRWWRFPFMTSNDLQLGALWTVADCRGEGLAKAAIDAVHRHFAPMPRRFWYVVRSDNLPSVRLIESCGYTLAATGVRTSHLGSAALGRFRPVSLSPLAARSSPTGLHRIDRLRGRSRAG